MHWLHNEGIRSTEFPAVFIQTEATHTLQSTRTYTGLIRAGQSNAICHKNPYAGIHRLNADVHLYFIQIEPNNKY